jgi:hypothetical protein
MTKRHVLCPSMSRGHRRRSVHHTARRTTSSGMEGRGRRNYGGRSHGLSGGRGGPPHHPEGSTPRTGAPVLTVPSSASTAGSRSTGGHRSPLPISSLRAPPARSSGSVHDGRAGRPSDRGRRGSRTRSVRSKPRRDRRPGRSVPYAGSFHIEARRTSRPGLAGGASSTWATAEPHPHRPGDIPGMEDLAGKGTSGKGGVQKNEPPG